METNSFKALYLTAKAKPTPGYAFIVEVARVTGKGVCPTAPNPRTPRPALYSPSISIFLKIFFSLNYSDNIV